MKKVILCSLALTFVLLGCKEKCDHAYTLQVTQVASCMQTGIETYTCSICADSYTKEIPITEHTFGAEEVEKAATCVDEGVVKTTCTVCGITRQTNTEKLPHSFGEAMVTKEPNCTEEGERTAICTDCGVSEVQEKLSTNEQHVFTSTVIREATCIDRGKGKKTCTLCQYSEEFEYDLKEHSYVSQITTKATCTKTGSKTITCSVCSKTATETIAALGHNYTTVSKENSSSTFASKCILQCKECKIEKTLYYVDKYEIDLNEIQRTLEKYAQDYGFRTTDSFADVPANQEIKHIGMLAVLVKANGGIDDMVMQAKYFIDQEYDSVKNSIWGVNHYLIHISVNYGESASIGGGAFSVRLIVTE